MYLPIQHFVGSIDCVRLKSKLCLLSNRLMYLLYGCLWSLLCELFVDGDARFLFSRLFVNTQRIEQIEYSSQFTDAYIIGGDAIQTTHGQCVQCVQAIVDVVKLHRKKMEEKRV